jgi:hypothetical protein
MQSRLTLWVWVAIAIVALSWGVALVLPHSSGAPPGYTDDFGESGCGVCHKGYYPDINLSISGVPAQYEPGNSYTISVTVSTRSTARCGFELSARYVGSGLQAGTWIVRGEGRIQVRTKRGVQYVTHT